MTQANVSHKRKHLLGFLLPFLMLSLASLACDLEQNLGELTNEPQTFEAREGWEYDWNAPVTPGNEYEVTLALADANTKPIYVIIDAITEVLCEECYSSIEGEVTVDGLSITFTASESGRAIIRVYVLAGGGRSIIQIRDTP